MEYSKIEGHNDLLRDSKTNSIININKLEYEKYITSREVKNEKNQKIQNIEREVDSIKNDVNEIKVLLRELLNGSR